MQSIRGVRLPQDELQCAWDEFWVDRSIERRNVLVMHYVSLVGYVASQIKNLPSSIEMDDLVSYGVFGLVDALNRFDPEKGVKFETYAIPRIRGSIIDELRSQDWVPRAVRSQGREIAKAAESFEQGQGRLPTHEELAGVLNLSVQELNVAVSRSNVPSVMSFDVDGDGRPSVSDFAHDNHGTPEDLASVADMANRAAKALSAMPEWYRMIAVLYYIERLTMKEIGAVLGVTESRICQLQAQMLEAFRDHLGIE
jgi:RNA polymerase sigma factor FliA